MWGVLFLIMVEFVETLIKYTAFLPLVGNGWQIGGRFNAANVLLPAVNIHNVNALSEDEE